MSTIRCDVVVIGAGAAGLMTAITAGQRGRQVQVIDHANKVGKKILMSGGGRCNFTNTGTTPANFLSANPHFCKSALARYTPWHFIELVSKHGIAYHEKELGQLFCDVSSKQIVKMLVDECQAAGVQVRTDCSVQRIEHGSDGFRVHTTQGLFHCASLVVATGGLSHQVHGERCGFNNPAWDEHYLDLFENDPVALTRVTHAEAAKLGGWEGSEIVMWLVMRGALSANVKKIHQYYYLPSMTAIASAARTVARRWATTTVVRPRAREASASVILDSEAVSRAEVA